MLTNLLGTVTCVACESLLKIMENMHEKRFKKTHVLLWNIL